MTGFDLHPEELLDRVRRGAASAAERERVAQHLESCEACRFEHALLAQSMRDAAPHPGDGARARRIEQAAASALAARGVLAPSAARRTRRASALLVAVVVSSLATAAAAAVITQPAWLARVLPARPVAASGPSAERGSHARRARKTVVAAPAPAPAPVIAAPSPPVPLADEPSGRQEDARPAGAQRGAVRSAAELFAAANLARREREPGTAVRLYRELARRHPRSPEASVSRVALGRLLLDRLSDARGALREFDAYLADASQRALREDALIGRALALGRLGRAREEHAAWQALIAAFPRSAYVERARARLAELR